MNPLKEKLNEILKVISTNKKIIYLDYPIHFNIWDLAIYHWTEAFFRENNIKILERFNIHNLSYGRINNLIKKHWDILFLWHWGWNMWDTYFEKAELKRRHFASTYANQEIVFLPQSIHYKDDNNLKSSIDIYNKSNRTVMVRDIPSFKLIQKNYPNAQTFLMPDMAYYLAESDYINNFKNYNWDLKEKLIISRIDEEKIDKKISQNNEVETTDWLLMTWFFIKISWYAIAWLLKLLSIFNLNSKLLTNLWYQVSKKLLSKGFNKLKSYKVIETDRLHGFIMSNLLWKEIITSDNYYGKIKNYKSTWNLK